jgi:hypothetical protein
MTHSNSSMRWHCPNRDCNWSMVATTTEDGEAPRCICGSPMEKIEPVPVLTYLDFLRGETSSDEDQSPDRE